jgi:2-hydroxy-3-keto-5-methylthiopentenyl-1-phosphate phosphatase
MTGSITPRVLVLCDFDGTVSTKDTVNRLIREHLTDPSWRFQVKRYLRGEIGSREVYEALGPMMKMSRQDLARFVDNHARIDPDFPEFLAWAGRNNIDVKILSDGFDATIETLFEKHNIRGLQVFANSLRITDDSKVTILSPHANLSCGKCGTCKLGVLNSFRSQYETIILIGDGESDRHAAQEADLVIALKDLFVYCAARGIPAIRADNFGEIPHLLSRRIEAVTFDMDGTLLDSIGAIAESFNHMFIRLGYPQMTVQEVVRKTSVSLMDFVRNFLQPHEAENGIKIFRDHYDTIFIEKTSLIQGVRDAIETMDGDVIKGIITNKRGAYARKLSDHFGFSKNMSMIIGAEDGFRAKPSAEMFHEFMRQTGSTKGQTIYVGDSPVDIEAAKNAGIDAFAVTGPYFTPEELALRSPRRVLRSITELPHAVKPAVRCF